MSSPSARVYDVSMPLGAGGLIYPGEYLLERGVVICLPLRLAGLEGAPGRAVLIG